MAERIEELKQELRTVVESLRKYSRRVDTRVRAILDGESQSREPVGASEYLDFAMKEASGELTGKVMYAVFYKVFPPGLLVPFELTPPDTQSGYEKLAEELKSRIVITEVA